MKFQELRLIEPILRALNEVGYDEATPIQEKSIPQLLQGRDIFGCAQTGTGKTAAFSIPILQLLYNSGVNRERPTLRGLILAPTRELAIQIGESIADYGKYTGIRHTVIFGGVSQHAQTQALKRGVHIIVATPGRLLDLMNQGFIRLNTIEFFVLDEADRMLDMGFIHDIKKIIVKLPPKRQTFFFSATVPPEIKSLVDSLLRNPINVNVAPVSSAAESVEQSVYFVEKTSKAALLCHVIKNESIDHALVFTRTKRGADRVAKTLKREGIQAEAIHGDKSQNARQKALNGFKDKTLRILVATDIASRGIDVDKLSHVFNYELPDVPETYVHRIGRTGRAGASGIAISFCSPDEKDNLKDITKLLKKNIPIAETPRNIAALPKPQFIPAAQEQQKKAGSNGNASGQKKNPRWNKRGNNQKRSGTGGGKQYRASSY
ncbi:MAG: ATP-dependent RNA helicase RhlE [Bacteroidetes bacterium]|nr:MAG: ATP-dependent RNA helicase RhlE [Bacteroidota bacterium]